MNREAAGEPDAAFPAEILHAAMPEPQLRAKTEMRGGQTFEASRRQLATSQRILCASGSRNNRQRHPLPLADRRAHYVDSICLCAPIGDPNEKSRRCCALVLCLCRIRD